VHAQPADLSEVSGARPASERQQSDAALVEAARGGDTEAFGVLYGRFARMVRAVLLARMPCQEVPDAIQDVFLSAWARLADLREAAAFGAWLAVIARHNASRFHRARLDIREPVEVGGAPSVEAFELLDAVRALPGAYRETLLLRFVEDMSAAEIAARTGLTEGSVRVNLHRGVKLLRERLAGTRRRGA
jgi:RNA polymerase sigma-70 factor (ECF subfamily)